MRPGLVQSSLDQGTCAAPPRGGAIGQPATGRGWCAVAAAVGYGWGMAAVWFELPRIRVLRVCALLARCVCDCGAAALHHFRGKAHATRGCEDGVCALPWGGAGESVQVWRHLSCGCYQSFCRWYCNHRRPSGTDLARGVPASILSACAMLPSCPSWVFVTSFRKHFETGG